MQKLLISKWNMKVLCLHYHNDNDDDDDDDDDASGEETEEIIPW